MAAWSGWEGWWPQAVASAAPEQCTGRENVCLTSLGVVAGLGAGLPQ